MAAETQATNLLLSDNTSFWSVNAPALKNHLTWKASALCVCPQSRGQRIYLWRRKVGSFNSPNFVQSIRTLSGAQPRLQLAEGADTLTPLQPRPRPTQLSLRNVLPHTILELPVDPRSTFSASVNMGHKKEGTGTWTSRWLLLLNNLFVHFANFLVPLLMPLF